jgi:Protein of unknown function (DUF2568)
VKAANLVLRFLLELGALAALAYGGFNAGSSEAIHWLLGIGLPLLAVVVWGLFIAPRRRYEVPNAVWVLLQVLIFGGAVVALLTTGQTTLAFVFAASVLLNATLMVLWHQRGEPEELGIAHKETL